MRSSMPKTATIAMAKPASPLPFLRRPVSILALGPRRPPVGRRVRDLEPGERVPEESRIVFRSARTAVMR